MHWKLWQRKQKLDLLHATPVISQVTEDTINNELIAIYYGKKNFEPSKDYLQEITLVFKDEQLRKHKYLDKPYRLIRQILYGCTVDIETFYIHVSTNDKTDYCLFPKIYSGNNDIHADNIHLDTKTPYPKHLIEKWNTDTLNENTPLYLSPYIYINTSNHAMATHDTNPTLQKTLYHTTHSVKKWKKPHTNIKIKFLTRKQVEKKYKKPCAFFFFYGVNIA
ncbi:MAG: hypothetical protein FWD52_08245 [Candidatus Bathyarchaeota archaeon]|nr:hypothetical protein [Candidatus Termiticorpusculum sp.]